ncbi:hypothetical protein INT44_006844 [Umbelopsis vinacea]|uniref:Pentatricopeptide repeat-containing protein n=1 Tax=Umbelopsis vinacea TaxID=44442 RepID=A0A8H7PIJ7_9FUNG|nr:hypothetical protein INT44_006844 [Umbelopsis vinacea]KAI9289899.1 hypothetical protein BC943DRAFT_312843 [Umbelopsis sp. AD052]
MLARRFPGWCRTTLNSFQQYSSAAAPKPKFAAASQPIANATKQGGKHKSHKLPDDPYLLSNKVSRLIKIGKHDEAMDLVKNAPIRLQSEVVWNQLISGQASQGKCNGAFKTLNEMKRRGFNPNEVTFTNLMTALAKNPSESSVARANDLYVTMQESGFISKIHFNALLNVYARCEAHREMMRLFDAMLESDVSPDKVTYSTLFNAFARQQIGTFEEIAMIWDRAQAQMAMLDNDKRAATLKMDDKMMASFLNAITNTGTLAKHYHMGLAAFDECYGLRISKRGRNPKLLDEDRAILSPTAVSFRSVLLLLNKARKFGLANEYIDELYGKIKPDTPALNAIVAIRYSEQKYSDAIDCLKKMQELGLRPNASSFDMFIRSCGKLYSGRDAKDPIVWQKLSMVLNQHASEVRRRHKQGIPDKDLQLSSRCCVEILRITRASVAAAPSIDDQREMYETALKSVESQRWRTAAKKVSSEKHALLAQWVAAGYEFLLNHTFEKNPPSREDRQEWEKSLSLAQQALPRNRGREDSQDR